MATLQSYNQANMNDLWPASGVGNVANVLQADATTYKIQLINGTIIK
jgi:hypothetical protein